MLNIAQIFLFFSLEIIAGREGSHNQTQKGHFPATVKEAVLACQCHLFHPEQLNQQGAVLGQPARQSSSPSFLLLHCNFRFLHFYIGGGGTILLVSMLLSAHVERFGGKLEAELFKL